MSSIDIKDQVNLQKNACDDLKSRYDTIKLNKEDAFEDLKQIKQLVDESKADIEEKSKEINYKDSSLALIIIENYKKNLRLLSFQIDQILDQRNENESKILIEEEKISKLVVKAEEIIQKLKECNFYSQIDHKNKEDEQTNVEIINTLNGLSTSYKYIHNILLNLDEQINQFKVLSEKMNSIETYKLSTKEESKEYYGEVLADIRKNSENIRNNLLSLKLDRFCIYWLEFGIELPSIINVIYELRDVYKTKTENLTIIEGLEIEDENIKLINEITALQEKILKYSRNTGNATIQVTNSINEMSMKELKSMYRKQIRCTNDEIKYLRDYYDIGDALFQKIISK